MCRRVADNFEESRGQLKQIFSYFIRFPSLSCVVGTVITVNNYIDFTVYVVVSDLNRSVREI